MATKADRYEGIDGLKAYAIIGIALIVQEELQQKKQITDGTEIFLTADNLQQYVEKIEVDRRKSTYTEFVF